MQLIAVVCGMIGNHDCKEYFKTLKASYTDAESAEAVRKVYDFTDGFLFSLMNNPFRESSINDDSFLKKLLAKERMIELCVKYGDAIIDTWGSESPFREIAVGIWTRYLIDNKMEISVSDRESARKNSVHCRKFIEPLTATDPQKSTPASEAKTNPGSVKPRTITLINLAIIVVAIMGLLTNKWTFLWGFMLIIALIVLLARGLMALAKKFGVKL